jgi:hypothetical protein
MLGGSLGILGCPSLPSLPIGILGPLGILVRHPSRALGSLVSLVGLGTLQIVCLPMDSGLV